MGDRPPTVRRFLEDLKERKVFHTAAAYAAAAFVIWEAADIAFPVLGLPPTAMRLVVVGAIAGLPVALVLSWAFEIRRERPLSDTVAAGRLRRLLRPARQVGAVLLVLTAGCAVAWVVVPSSPMSLSGEEWVVLADLENRAGDPVFDESLVGALRVALNQSSLVSLLPPVHVERALEQMRRPPDEPLDEPTALELAQREGAAAVVVPSVAPADRGFVVSTRILDPATAETVVSRTARAGDREGVLEALDELARQLRADLGESLPAMVRHRVRLHRATTASLPALKAWTEGGRHFDAGRMEEAGLMYRRAVELDSTFALAQADLGAWYYWARDDFRTGNAHFEAALRHADRVTERERLMIEGVAAEWRGDREGALAVYRAAVTLDDRDLSAWGKLAYQHLRLGRLEEGAAAYRRVLELDSLDASAWLNLATIEGSRHDFEAAVPLYERAFRLQPDLRTVPNINEEYGRVLIHLGRISEAESAFRDMAELPGGGRARGLRSLAQLRSYQGRFTEAVELLEEVVVLLESAGQPTSEVRSRGYLAQALARAGGRERATTQLLTAAEVALREQVPAFWVATTGVHLVRIGTVEPARELLDTARARMQGAAPVEARVRHLEAEIAAAGGELVTAREGLEGARALQPDDTWVLASLARLHRSLGDTVASAAAWRAVLAEEALGLEAQNDWVLARYELARLLEASGDVEGAIRRYRDFLDAWAAGGPTQPEVADARARLTTLEG